MSAKIGLNTFYDEYLCDMNVSLLMGHPRTAYYIHITQNISTSWPKRMYDFIFFPSFIYTHFVSNLFLFFHYVFLLYS